MEPKPAYLVKRKVLWCLACGQPLGFVYDNGNRSYLLRGSERIVRGEVVCEACGVVRRFCGHKIKPAC